ncbi:MAG: glucuronyl hydrolase, partial [Flavobacteriaceae bacterium]
LFNATKISGDSSYYKIAVSHADKTLQHHFRDNNSSFHVLDYDPETGNVLNKNTHQGYSDSSSWARGQAWGLYGYTMCYRETGLKRYLDQAIAIAEYIMDSPNMPKDGIPLWDYDAPKGEGAEPRDASAACITASALYELAVLTDSPKGKFGQWADRIIDHLATPEYFPGGEANRGFLLGHSVGSLPHGVEVDVPLNYADYYFLEALLRKKNIMGL